MKYMIRATVLFVLILLGNCQVPLSVPEFQTRYEAMTWVSDNIEYISDKEVKPYKNYWQPPEVTLQRGTGDCEDKAILLMQIVHDQFGDQPELAIVDITSGPDKGIRHAVALIRGMFYDPTYWPRGQAPIETYSFEVYKYIEYDVTLFYTRTPFIIDLYIYHLLPE